MSFFDLPERSRVQRVVPKNAFDKFTSNKQKKLLRESVKRISWTHKLSSGTINLNGNKITEIQVFEVELKQKADVSRLLEIIQKVIPYNIVFWVRYDDDVFVSTAIKHPHPNNDDLSIIDWTFSSGWVDSTACDYEFNLKKSLEFVLKDMCIQLIDHADLYVKFSLDEIVDYERKRTALINEITGIKSQMYKSKQFNKKLELNVLLKEKERALKELFLSPH